MVLTLRHRDVSRVNRASLFRVTHQTEPVEVIIDTHHELLTFHVFQSAQHPLILSLLWLKQHNIYRLVLRRGERVGRKLYCVMS